MQTVLTITILVDTESFQKFKRTHKEAIRDSISIALSPIFQSPITISKWKATYANTSME